MLHTFYDLHGLDAYGADALQQVYYMIFVVGEAVGVELFGNRGIFGFLFLVLVENPFQCTSAAELVIPAFRWDAM